MPRATVSSRVLSFSLGTPAILPLAFGAVAALAAGGLLQVVGLPAAEAAQCVCLVAALAKR